MFYLKNFIQSLLSRPLLGGGLIITSIVMSILLMQGQNIQERLSAYYRPGLERPYFNAVINTEKLNNISGILRKLTKLPGVFKVEIVQEQEISKKVSSFITKNEINTISQLILLDMTMKKMNSNRLLVSDEMSAEFRIRRTQQNLLRNEIAKIEMQIYPSHLKMRI